MSHVIRVQLVRYYTEPFIFHAFSRWLIHDTGTTDLWVGGSNPSGRANKIRTERLRQKRCREQPTNRRHISSTLELAGGWIENFRCLQLGGFRHRLPTAQAPGYEHVFIEW